MVNYLDTPRGDTSLSCSALMGANQRGSLEAIARDLERSGRWLQGLEARTEYPRLTNLTVKSVLFYRNFERFSGGHLKVWHYFNHVQGCAGYHPYIYFYTPESVWDFTNPWRRTAPHRLLSQPLSEPDVIFLDGLDWQAIAPQKRDDSQTPIINLIQHVRHGNPDNPRYEFLSHKAIRICVSDAVAMALQESGRVNGPLFVIPNALDMQELPAPLEDSQREETILIAALKEPALGERIKTELESLGHPVRLLCDRLPRRDYLQQLRQVKMAVFLPNRQEGEGFYLPALEAMALRTLVICPDCLGNRGFCLPGQTCFRPNYQLAEIIETVKTALTLNDSEQETLLNQAQKQVDAHQLEEEQHQFQDILENVADIW